MEGDKTMKKRLWMAALIAALTLALSACGDKGGNNMNDKTPASADMTDSDMKSDDMMKDDMMKDDMKSDDMMKDDMKSDDMKNGDM